MRPVRQAAGTGPAAEGPALLATELGDAVHRLLELVDLDEPRSPGLADLTATVRGWYPAVTAPEIDRIAAHVDAYCTSALAARIAGLGGARPERPFTFEVGGVLLRGRLDVLWRSGPRALVLDYKTNLLLDHSPAHVVETEYRLQRAVYALACLLAGAHEVEVIYQFLESPEEVVAQVFTTLDLDALRTEVGAAIDRVTEGEIRARPSAYACLGCPLLGVACSGTDALEEPFE